MKKFFLNKCATLVMALAMILGLGLTTPRSQAAGSCVVTFSDPTVTVGSNVTISVRVSGQVAIGTVKVTFDPEYLQYVSGDLGYGSCNGNVIVMDKENMGSGNLSFSMTFKALKVGKTTIDNYENSIVDSNGDFLDVFIGR